MGAIKVKDLLKICELEVKKGHGDYTIMISRDDEGNDYHYLWFSFQTIENFEKEVHKFDKDFKFENQYSLDERTASKDKTILLG